MIFAAINWLSISINLLLVVFVIICLLMTLVILMQRPKQEGLGAAFGAGVTDQVFGARTTNVLQRATVYLGSLFFIISLVLAILIGQQNRSHTLVDLHAALATPVEETTPEAEAPAETPAPASLADELPAEPATTPEIPAVPEEAPADGSEGAPVAPAEPEAPAAPESGETPEAPGEPEAPATPSENPEQP